MNIEGKNIFYIPNLGYVHNEKIWLRFEKLMEHLYNECQVTVDIYDESCEIDQFCKHSWISHLLNEGKYEDA